MVDNVKCIYIIFIFHYYMWWGGELDRDVEGQQAFPPCCLLLRSILKLLYISHIQIMG